MLHGGGWVYVHEIPPNLSEWPPVSPADSRVLTLIIHKDKVPGKVMISSQMLAININWWSPISVNVITYTIA